MTNPSADEIPSVIDLVAKHASSYLDGIDDRPVREAGAEEVALGFGGPLPESGVGAIAALEELAGGFDATIRSAGARFFHFVNGGTTPAALGADWLVSATDQNVGAWVSSPLGARLEQVALAWLKELFGFPPSWSGILTTGATMANFTALACARRWAGLEQGVDVEEDGLASLPPIPVFGSGYMHPSDIKVLSMLGIGRANIHMLARDGVGRVDLQALETALRERGGAPSIVIVSAGEVNAGDFDPMDAMIDLGRRHGAWVHVDGAFGLFAALSERSRHLVEGVEHADSAIADGHKWLNVPYESGFAFVKDDAAAGGVHIGCGVPGGPR